MQASFMQNPDGSLQTDPNKFELYCGAELVGTVNFDMSTYKGQAPIPQRSTIVAEGSEVTNLIGNPDAYPNAFVEFRISLMDKGSAEEAKTKAAISGRHSIKNIKRTSSLLPSSAAALESAQEDPGAVLSLNLRISELETNLTKAQRQNKTLAEEANQEREKRQALEVEIAALNEGNDRLKHANRALEAEKQALGDAQDAEAYA